MTAPNTTPAVAPAPSAPKITQAHTWAFVALSAFGSIFSAFAPKITAYASAHPTGAILVTGAAAVIGSVLPSATGAGQPPASP